MKRNLKILMFLLVAVFLCSGNVFADGFGTDKTIFDGVKASSGSSWYTNTNEDQEVEPGNVTGQQWDLEGFFLDGAKLTMVGGYNFKTGEKDPYRNLTYYSGDIFLDVTGDFKFGSSSGSGDGYKSIPNSFGYDYAINLDFANNKYNVYSLTSGSQLTSVYFRQNDKSNAFEYKSAIDENPYLTGSLGYLTALSDDEAGFLGGSHNAVIIDLSFLGNNVTFTSHFTMGCGNDNLIGKGTTSVPEPTPMLLLGGALIGLAGIGRRKFFKN